MTDLVVETRALTKRYGARFAVRELALEVPRGAVFGLLGRNGAGKSTTIRMLLGLVRPTAGSVQLLGRPLASERLALLGRVGALVEGPAFYPYLSAAQNLTLLGELSGGVTPAQVHESLERVGLSDRADDRYAGFSTGMRQRLGIAAALLGDPELVILDEPLNGLDPPAVLVVRDLIRGLAAAGTTVIVSSHVLHEVELVCDRVAVMARGRRVAHGAVAELLRGEHPRFHLQVDDAPRAADVARALPFVASAAATDDRLVVDLEEDAPARLNRALVEAGLEVAALARVERTLEELFHEVSTAADDAAEGEAAA